MYCQVRRYLTEHVQHVLLSSPQPWLFLGANLLNAVTTLPGIDYESWTMLKAVEAALMLLLTCVVLYKIPRATGMFNDTFQDLF